jgi:putative peptide zinc metalloprotease protein
MMTEAEFTFDGFKGFEEQLQFDSLERSRTYLIVDPNGTHVRLSSSAYALVCAVRSGMSFEELAKALNNNSSAKTTAKHLRAAYRDIVRKLMKIERDFTGQRLPWGFWARVRILPRTLVRKISSVLTFLYHPVLAFLFVGLIAAGIVYSLKSTIKFEVSDSSFVLGYTLFISSLIAHEFGHSTACTRFGAKPSEIGFAMYLIYPALYSDVTSTWQLSRWRRVVVDLGGCYFQFIAGLGFLAAFEFTRWAPWKLAFLMIVYTSVFSLNPIFKFDGYWVLADILGVTNLAQQPSRIGRYFLSRFTNSTTKPLPWSRSVLAFLVLYSIASTLVWGSFVWKLMPALWTRVLKFNLQVHSLRAELTSGIAPGWHEVKGILGSIYVLFILVVVMWQLARRFLAPLWKKGISYYRGALKKNSVQVQAASQVETSSLHAIRTIPNSPLIRRSRVTTGQLNEGE